MGEILSQVIRLWTIPLAEADRLDAFRKVYAETVAINGEPVPLSAIVARAQGLHRAFTQLEMQVLERIETPRKISVVFQQRGRHTGTLSTPLGDVPATGKSFERQLSDTFTLDDAGRIAGVRVVGDELALLLQLDAVQLKASAAPR